MLDRKAKSFEEREEEYERVKLRIFKKREMEAAGAAAAAAGGDRSGYWPQWGGSDSCSDQEAAAALARPKAKNSHRLLKMQSLVIQLSVFQGMHSFSGKALASIPHRVTNLQKVLE